MSTACSINSISPTDAQAQVENGETVLIDVREPFERSAAFIPGSHAAPLSSFDAAAIQNAHPNSRIVFQCKSGMRSADAAGRFAKATGATEVWSLNGGIQAWKSAGLPVERSAAAPKLDVMRQVQVVIGLLVIAGVLLSRFVSPHFIWLAGAVGAGVLFAGLSGWCGMACLIGNMPWNRDPSETYKKPKTSCSSGGGCCSG
ncbi:MAG: rhodanese-like domain-containing protein [Algisphaera sp.]